MPRLYLGNVDEEQPESAWCKVEIAPWNGDLKLKIKPATEGVLRVIRERAKSNKNASPQTISIEGKQVELPPNGNLAFQEEYVRYVVDEWEGVEEDLPCNDTNKLLLHRASLSLVGFIMRRAEETAGVKLRADLGNS